MWLLTIVVAAAGCGWTAVQGVGYVRYYMASEDVAAGPPNAGSLAAWTATPGLASVALEALLRGPADNAGSEAFQKRADLLTRLLAIKPSASQAWLSLAAVRNALAMTPEQVDAAFTMSGLTGPAEGAVMLERSLLGILLWERSSLSARARTATDLCGLSLFDPGKIRLVMTTKTEATRAEIRAGLEANACPPKTIKMVGL
jgi:hypothetical protein